MYMLDDIASDATLTTAVLHSHSSGIHVGACRLRCRLPPPLTGSGQDVVWRRRLHRGGHKHGGNKVDCPADRGLLLCLEGKPRWEVEGKGEFCG